MLSQGHICSEIHQMRHVSLAKDKVPMVGSLRCLKESKQWTRYFVSVNSKKILIFNICCWYTLKWPHRGHFNVDLQHMSFLP